MPGAETASQSAREPSVPTLYPATVQRLGEIVATGELHARQPVHEESALLKDTDAASPHRLGLDLGTPGMPDSHSEIDIGSLTVQKVIDGCSYFAAVAAASPELAKAMAAKEVRNLQEVASLRQAGMSDGDIKERQWATMANRFKGKVKPGPKPDVKIEPPQVKPAEQQTVAVEEPPGQQPEQKSTPAAAWLYLPEEVIVARQGDEVRRLRPDAAVTVAANAVPTAERLAEPPAERDSLAHGGEQPIRSYVSQAYEGLGLEHRDDVPRVMHLDATETAGQLHTANPLEGENLESSWRSSMQPFDDLERAAEAAGRGDQAIETEQPADIEALLSSRFDAVPASVDDADCEDGSAVKKLPRPHLVIPPLGQAEVFGGDSGPSPLGVEVARKQLEIYEKFTEAMQVLVAASSDQPAAQLISESPGTYNNDLVTSDELQATLPPAPIVAAVAEKLGALTVEEKEETAPVVVKIVGTVRAIETLTAEGSDPESIEIMRSELEDLVVVLFTRLGVSYEAADPSQFVALLLQLDTLPLSPDTLDVVEVSLEEMGTHEVKIRMPRDATAASVAHDSHTLGRLFMLGMFALFNAMSYLGREYAPAAA